jgi:D-alanyl-lipoteichoic acid acyltransferase DltB (MBOAT superfamily)
VVTFTLGGLWHGLSWTFAVWGLLHGGGLALHRFVQARRPARKRGDRERSQGLRAAGTILTFHFVALAWVFFRSTTLAQAWSVFRVLADGSSGAGNISWSIGLAIVVGLGSQFLPDRWWPWLQTRFVLLPPAFQATALLVIALLVRHASGSNVASFIYFAF